MLRTVRPDLAARLQWRDERGAAAVVDAFVGRGDTVVDVGAHVGVHAYRYARLVGRDGCVHAFEAHPAYERHLRRLAQLPQGRLHMVALSDHEGEGELGVPVIGGAVVDAMAGLVPRTEPGTSGALTFRVPVRRLDDVLPGDARLTFLKCDVEGHERRVLEGARRTLDRAMPVLLVEIEQRHQQEDVRPTFDLVQRLGYQGFALRGDGLVALEDFDLDRDQVRLQPTPGFPPPPEYVDDFLFVPHGRPLPPALAAKLVRAGT